MACVGEDNPCFIAGDDVYYDVTFTDSDEVAKDLTGATAVMELRDDVTSATVVDTMNGGIVTPLSGQMRFTLTDTESALLCPRADASKSYKFSVKITYSDATEETILVGTITFEQAATA